VEYSGSSVLILQGSEPAALILSSVVPAWAVAVVPISSHAVESRSTEVLLMRVRYLINTNRRAYV
jgi:hypothetical protein